MTVGLLIHFLAFDKKAYFYHSSFQILNVEYTEALNSPATQEHRHLSERIESMITNAFRESDLKSEFIRTHVVKLRVMSDFGTGQSVFLERCKQEHPTVCVQQTRKSLQGELSGAHDSEVLSKGSSYSNPLQWTATFGVSTVLPNLRVRIRAIRVHNNYRPTTRDNDIAVIQLERPITFTRNIHSVCLPAATQSIIPGSVAYVTGWGSLTYGGNTVTDLRQGQVRIISNEVCNEPSGYGGSVLPGMLCAGVPSGSVDACQGDSGGPLVQEDSRRLWFVVGIVSWGYQCGLPNKPGVYTRVTTYRDWIRQQTGI
ncbi:hypothetical protein ACRRTK_014933 [Alexandromys fortis]